MISTIEPDDAPRHHQLKRLSFLRLFTLVFVYGLFSGLGFAYYAYTEFAHELFGGHLDVRFRPSYFPFVEPGAEVDIECFQCHGSGCRLCKQSGWIEILGCGMVHPHVFRQVGYDPEEVSGYACSRLSPARRAPR